MFNNITNLIFDLDGTLTDPGLGISRCALHTARELGRPEPTAEQLRACVGPPLRESFVGLLGSDDPELIERAVEIYRERTASHGIYENEVYPGVEQMLITLRDRGYRLLMATSRPGIFTTAILQHFKLDHFFPVRFCAEMDGSQSEKSELIGLLLAGEGLSAESCVMIGDRKHDVIGAKHHGVRSVGVTYGYGSLEELQGAGADHLCASAAEITELLVGK